MFQQNHNSLCSLLISLRISLSKLVINLAFSVETFICLSHVFILVLFSSEVCAECISHIVLGFLFSMKPHNCSDHESAMSELDLPMYIPSVSSGSLDPLVHFQHIFVTLYHTCQCLICDRNVL